MDSGSVFQGLAAHGLPGIIIFVLGTWIVLLYRELRLEQHARIDDVKEANKSLIGMSERVNATAEKLSDVMTEIKDRDREREMRQRPRS